TPSYSSSPHIYLLWDRDGCGRAWDSRSSGQQGRFPMKSNSHTKSLGAELRLILKRARQVWRLVPRRHKWAFCGAILVMALTRACSTAMPLLLGGLVDEVKVGSDRGVTHVALYQVALGFLGLIAAAYVLREAFQVVRRYLVENNCTRIHRDITVKL